MNRYYKLISTSLDLQRLQDEAAKENKTAVGISNSGALYKYDQAAKKPLIIQKEEAAIILDTTLENIQKIIDSKGSFVIVDPVPEEVGVDDVPVEETNQPEPAIAETKEINPVPDGLKEDKLDRILNLLETIVEELNGLKASNNSNNTEVVSTVESINHHIDTKMDKAIEVIEEIKNDFDSILLK